LATHGLGLEGIAIIGYHYLIVNQKLSNCTPTKGKSSLMSHSILASKLLRKPALRGWERLFVKTLAASHNPGRKQLEKLKEIALRLGYSLAEEGGEA
jgi:hypothetical protein